MSIDFELPPVIAHRGASAQAPENTLAAIALAVEQGTKWIEIDVNRSVDGQLFVHHDDTLNRCTNGQGYLVAAKATELTALDAGSWFDPRYAGEPLPTLQQVCDLLKPSGTGVNLEIKATPGADFELAEDVCRFLKQQWPGELPVLPSSFSPLVLEEFRRQLPNHPLGLLVSSVPTDWQDWMQRYNCTTFHCAEAFATAELCEAAKDAGYPLLCYTVNSIERARELWDMGVSSVFSDIAHELIASS